MEEENIDPIDVLREDLADDAVDVQLDAVRSLRTIILALGPERSCSQLMPFLDKHCFPVEVTTAKSPESYSNVKTLACKEEVLREIAIALNGELVPYFGGSDAVGKHVMPLMEKLAQVEETVIRESAVASIVSLSEKMVPKHVDLYIPPIVSHLAEGDWWTSRFSAAGLAPMMYPVFTNAKLKEQMLDTLSRLAKDEMPMVRQQAYRSTPVLLKSMPKDRLISFLTPILKALSKELQESIRNTMVDMVRELASLSKEPEIAQLCTQHLKTTVQDENWRIRKRFVSQIMEIAKTSPTSLLNSAVLQSFIERLTDTEPSVRVKAIKTMPTFLPLCENDAVAEYVTKDIITTIVDDQYPEVREAISASFLYMGPALKDVEVVNTLKAFSTDEQGEVRLNFCSSLGKACALIGWESFLESLVPVVQKLHADPKWRVRHDILKNCRPIAEIIGEKEFESSPIKKLLFESFRDPVNDVRDEAINQIVELTKTFSYDWTNRVIMPSILSIYDEKNKYLHRMIPLKCVRAIADLIPREEMKAITPVILKACRDRTSNVRLLATEALKAIIPKLSKTVIDNDVRPILKTMSSDRDADVKFYAGVAMKTI